MPDQGRLTEQRVPHTPPVIAPLYPPPPWKLQGARVLKVVYETDVEALLAWLPAKLTRSSPPYVVITVAHYPASPIGEFSVAVQHLGCRAGFFIRALSLQATADSVTAMAALREVWGYPCRFGGVSLSVAGETVEGNVNEGGADGVRISLSQAQPIDGDLIRFDPVLNLRVVPSIAEGKKHDLMQMVQIDPDYAVGRALRGSGALELGKGTSWAALPVQNVISTVYCEMDAELPLARFVMPY